MMPSCVVLRPGQYTELFPVQAAAWRVLAGGLSKAHDLCIAAPTGSGKTLAYALPVLHSLLGCVSMQDPLQQETRNVVTAVITPLAFTQDVIFVASHAHQLRQPHISNGTQGLPSS